MHVDDSCGNALCCQNFRRLQRFLHHQAGGYDRKIAALSDLDALSDLEAEGFRVVYGFHGKPAKPDIDRSVMVNCSLHRKLRFDFIAGTEHDHVRERPHDRQILQALMGSSVLAHRKSRMRCAYFYVQLRIANGIPNLLAGTFRCKNRKRAGENDFSRRRKPRRDTHHICLCDSHIEMSFGIYLFEGICFRRFRQVGVKNDDPFIRSVLCQCRSVSLSCCYLTHVLKPPLRFLSQCPPSARQALRSPDLSAPDSEPCRARNNCFP